MLLDCVILWFALALGQTIASVLDSCHSLFGYYLCVQGSQQCMCTVYVVLCQAPKLWICPYKQKSCLRCFQGFGLSHTDINLLVMVAESHGMKRSLLMELHKTLRCVRGAFLSVVLSIWDALQISRIPAKTKVHVFPYTATIFLWCSGQFLVVCKSIKIM